MHDTTIKTSHQQSLIASVLLAALAVASAAAWAQQSEEEIALAAQNPVAAMVSLPLQYNYDQNIGPREDGHKNYVNVQPVIPFSLDEDWNLISRTIMPVVWQSDLFPGAGSQSGIGDITQSFFFSPKKPSAGGWIWGVGPVIYLPTASDDLLGADKWGLGPTAVFLKQEHGWTYGALANHIWSTGGSGRADINNTFLQPFLTYTTKTFTSFTANSESTYNWETENWSVPINLMVSQLLKVGEQRLQLQAGARYWADSPDSGPHGWGARFTVTFLFPK
ncbi:MAG: transporter [Candidatus Competibacteraceae bacterium]